MPLLEILQSIIAYKKRIMQVNGALHTQKSPVTVGEFVSMVKDKNWKKDISYILTEKLEEKTNKWKEIPPLEPVTDVNMINYDHAKNVLQFSTESLFATFINVTDSTLMQDIIPADSPELRITIYMT